MCACDLTELFPCLQPLLFLMNNNLDSVNVSDLNRGDSLLASDRGSSWKYVGHWLTSPAVILLVQTHSGFGLFLIRKVY